MKPLYIVVDVQNDFTTGTLGSKEAVIAGNNIDKFLSDKNNPTILWTRDTHFDDYLDTQEGKNLPIIHCKHKTEGWDIYNPLQKYVDEGNVIDKFSFGSIKLAEKAKNHVDNCGYDEIILMGICTDICVVSNFAILKAMLPEIPIKVFIDGCAGLDGFGPKHEAAIEVMKSNQAILI